MIDTTILLPRRSTYYLAEPCRIPYDAQTIPIVSHIPARVTRRAAAMAAAHQACRYRHATHIFTYTCLVLLLRVLMISPSRAVEAGLTLTSQRSICETLARPTSPHAGPSPCSSGGAAWGQRCLVGDCERHIAARIERRGGEAASGRRSSLRTLPDIVGDAADSGDDEHAAEADAHNLAGAEPFLARWREWRRRGRQSWGRRRRRWQWRRRRRRRRRGWRRRR